MRTGDTIEPMLAPAPISHRRPPPGALAERTRPDGPSAQITCIGRTAEAAPRLVVTAGPRKGAEFLLVEPLTTVGRASANGVAIADRSISRRHSRLEKRGRGWVVCDQGSGNGTRVNGRRVDRRRLRDGDEIAIGDTRLRFLESDGVLAWTEIAASAGLRGKAHLYGAALVALCIVLAAGLVRQRRLRESAEAEARAHAVRAAARAYLAESVALGKLGKWSEAHDALRVAKELDPGDPEIARSLQSAEAEWARPAEARSAIVGADAPGVAPAPIASSPRPGPARNAAPAQPILAAWLEGNVALALARAKAVRSPAGQRLAALLGRFAAAHRTGMAEADPALAVRALEDASQAARAIAQGEGGRPGREVGKALAVRHLLLARGLSGEEALPQAAEHLRAAVQSDPANGEARAEMERLAGQAREIYLRAYLAKEGDPAGARRGFALVAQALLTEDETGEKARRWLAKLDGKAAR
jgi:tetratricopeptide (TPR) repeat protein